MFMFSILAINFHRKKTLLTILLLNLTDAINIYQQAKTKIHSLNECCIFNCVKKFEINDTLEYSFVTEACSRMAALLTIKNSNMQKINLNLRKERETSKETRKDYKLSR